MKRTQEKVIGRLLIVWLWSNLTWIQRVISNYRVFIPTTQRELICTRQAGPKIMKLTRSIKAKRPGKGKNVIIYIETEASRRFLALPPIVLPFPALQFSFDWHATKGKLIFFHVIIRHFLHLLLNS